MTRQKMIVNSNDGDPNISNWCNIACHLNTLAHLFIMLSLKVNIYIYIYHFPVSKFLRGGQISILETYTCFPVLCNLD